MIPSIYKRIMKKNAAELLTPQAQAAAAQPPPQGAPMDPSMMGAPAGAPPMDPSMGGMPTQGAPMDPSMMAPQGMPPQGGGAWMNDPEFMQFLQMMGAQIDPNSGTVIDPNGQPVPPEQLEQLYMQFDQQRQMAMQQQGGMPPQGAPMDPSTTGAPAGAPPMDPSMGGMPPQGMPPEGMPMQGAPQEDPMNQVLSVVVDAVNASLQQKMAVLDKKISAFAQKLDTMKNMLDDLTLNSETAAKNNSVDDELKEELMNQTKEASVSIPKIATVSGVSLLDFMKG